MCGVNVCGVKVCRVKVCRVKVCRVKVCRVKVILSLWVKKNPVRSDTDCIMHNRVNKLYIKTLNIIIFKCKAGSHCIDEDIVPHR